MALVNDKETKRIEFEDGDWYELKKELGYYDNTISIWGDYTVEETRQKEEEVIAQQVAQKAEAQQNGSGIADNITAGEYIARTHITRMFARIAEWSHEDPVTMVNVRRIPPDQARELMAEIRDLEAATRPFREEPEAS